MILVQRELHIDIVAQIDQTMVDLIQIFIPELGFSIGYPALFNPFRCFIRIIRSIVRIETNGQ